MKWLVGILCVITLSVWGGVIWTIAGINATDVDPATYHASINNEMEQKVRVNNYFEFIPTVVLIEDESRNVQNYQMKNEETQKGEHALEKYIGQVNPYESISIDTLLTEMGIETVAARY